LGSALGAGLARVTGMGDYEVNSLVTPVAQKALTGELTPRMYEFTNSELIQPLTSSGSTFTIQSFSNNPGLSTFPWLSSIAQRFNKYRFKQLMYVFESTSSEYASGAALGTVAIATNYDTLDRAFSNMTELEATENCISGKPSVSKIHGVECASADEPFRWRFVRSAIPPTNSDLRLYDHSTTYIATEGLSATSGTIIGRIKVLYTVQFMNPIAIGIPSASLPAAPATAGWLTTTAGAAGVGPWLGVTANSTQPTSTFTTFGSTNLLPFTIFGTAYGNANYPVFGLGSGTGGWATLTFNCSGTYRITAQWLFSTAPTSGALSLIASTGARYYSAYTGYPDTTSWAISSDKTSSYVDVILVVSGASTTTTRTLQFQTAASWGASYVVSSAYCAVAYLGPP